MKKMVSGLQKTVIVTVGAGIVKGFVERGSTSDHFGRHTDHQVSI
jgi:hypothetical protein